MSMKKGNQWLIYDEVNNQFHLYIGHPSRSDSTKVDVTMAVSIGMSIASGNYEAIENEKVVLYNAIKC